MQFTRLLSIPNVPVHDQIKWKTVTTKIQDKNGAYIFGPMDVEVPEDWSDRAANILASKYLRKAGVPKEVSFLHRKLQYNSEVPEWLRPSRLFAHITENDLGSETSAHQIFHRMAGAWTYWGWKEGYFGGNLTCAQIFYDEIYLMLAHQIAAPNSPQWFNTGLHWAYGIEGDANGQWAFDKEGNIFETTNAYERPQVHACFINSLDDNLVEKNGIFDLLEREARIFKFGSGAGTNFSALRGKGESLSGGGKSSGLMSFLDIFDKAAGAIQSGGTTRRAAKMICLDLDHPEIEAFIEWKTREERKAKAMELGSDGEFGTEWEGEAIRTVSGQNSNNSVRITNDFMNRVDHKEIWALKERRTKKDIKLIPAKDLWDKICRAAWASADPGLLFHDTINLWNTCKNDGDIVACNPCGEYQWLNDTGCNLASINLVKAVNGKINGRLDLRRFEHACRLWTIVLDISVSMASYPSKEIAQGSYNYRTLGLGYANLGGLLARQGLRYDSDEGRNLASCLTAIMHGVSYNTSGEMAKELGPFPRFLHNQESMHDVLNMHGSAASKLRDEHLNNYLYSAYKGTYTGYRNAQVTLLAPTGTISFVMDCETTGIEPFSGKALVKSLAGGGEMEITHEVLDEDCAFPSYEGGPCLSGEAHVKMMAAVQPFLSGAISKTVNMPSNATVEDVDNIYRLAHKLGVKAVALYRDGSKVSQPLNVKKENIKITGEQISEALEIATANELIEEMIRGVPTNRIDRGGRYALSPRRLGYTHKFKLDGQSFFLRTGQYEDGKLGEIFINSSKEGSTARAYLEGFAKAISLGLQYGVPLEEFVEAFIHTRFEPSGVVQGHDRIKICSSIFDLIFRDLGLTYLGKEELANVKKEEIREINNNEIQQGDTIGITVDLGNSNLQDTFLSEDKTYAMMHFGPDSNSGTFCSDCGSQMRSNGTCFTCPNCFANTGCG